ncbi:glycerate kinase [Desulfopila aestuarii]|uniref:Glycerate kinase n=1 Tax=Desulfopila aestuarii DSM 18488 TaxID=1121416 RepID=A0A1M7Y663_9BACT|nr:glycerate kinase [Desulfopila aestuarii]SHO47883.1 glycerate kinase [Desulfopila aestuarii DSM 18488]
MKIVVAPNAFKGSLSAIDAANAMRKGIHAALPACEVVSVPVADGGDGFTEVMTEALKGELIQVAVHGPRMKRCDAFFGYIRETGVAIIEMAKASGLALLPDEQRNPMETSTYGTGELILAALDRGATRIIIGLGGSATCDGGIGMAAALGYTFSDISGTELPPIGKSLQSIHTIDTSGADHRLTKIDFSGICDVTNPLFGLDGASHVYSPQKGASLEEVRLLDKGLENLAGVILRDLGKDVATMPGGGAAGGLGAGLFAFLGARLEKGIDVVMELVQLRNACHGADLVITGEGQIDFQTKFDKAPAGVARIAKEMGIPCIAICGGIGERIDELHDIGITAVFSICQRPMALESAMRDSSSLLVNTTEQTVRLFMANTRWF